MSEVRRLASWLICRLTVRSRDRADRVWASCLPGRMWGPGPDPLPVSDRRLVGSAYTAAASRSNKEVRASA